MRFSEYTDRGGFAKFELGLEENGQAAEKFSQCHYPKSNFELGLIPASFGWVPVPVWANVFSTRRAAIEVSAGLRRFLAQAQVTGIIGLDNDKQ